MLFDEERYHRFGGIGERFFGRLGDRRKVAVRGERLPDASLGRVRLTCNAILWEVLKQVRCKKTLNNGDSHNVR